MNYSSVKISFLKNWCFKHRELIKETQTSQFNDVVNVSRNKETALTVADWF